MKHTERIQTAPTKAEKMVHHASTATPSTSQLLAVVVTIPKCFAGNRLDMMRRRDDLKRLRGKVKLRAMVSKAVMSRV